jgi:hypothetical protein
VGQSIYGEWVREHPAPRVRFLAERRLRRDLDRGVADLEEYLRERDPRLLAPILRHNARDVLSLVRIADRVARAVLAARSGRAPDHAPAALALARVFERTGEQEPAFCCYESAYVEGDAEVRVRAALPFARALERRGEAGRAVQMLETLLALGLGTASWREQAEARVRRLMRARWRELRPAS